MGKQKKKICICSDTLARISGLGKTALRIAKGFYDNDYDICYFVLTGQDSDNSCSPYYGDSYKQLFNDMTIYNCQLMNIEKYKFFDDYIAQEKPDIVLSLLDPWNLDQIQTSIYRDTYYWIAYCLFETPEYPEYVKTASPVKNTLPVRSIFDPLRSADLCIPVTQMGKNILTKAGIIPYDNIYLGVDFDLRCTDSSVTKQSVFGDANKDAFIFMTVGRNSERKKVDKSIEAFAKFKSLRKKDSRQYKLYVHTDYTENVGGTDIITQATSLGVIDDVLLPLCFQTNQVMMDTDLYKRYKACDAYIGLSAGEGFGYGFIEALMHEKPVIYLNYGGHKEYCYQFGYAVNPESFYHARDIYMKWALPDIDETVKYMNYCVDNKNDLSDESMFVQNNFDWDKIIIPKLIEAVESNYKEKKRLSYNLKRIL